MKKHFVSSLTLPNKTIHQILHNRIDKFKKQIRNNTQQDVQLGHQIMGKVKYIPNQINIVSLFSGAGGLDLGTELAGISAKYGSKLAYHVIKNRKLFNKYQNVSHIMYTNDNFKEANSTYRKNISDQDTVQDKRNVKDVLHFPKCDLMLGGFPCPGFSVAGPRLLTDSRNYLYLNYVRALLDAKPKFFVAENVKGLMSMGHGQVLKQIAKDFASAGYQINVNLVNAYDYGVPESRQRVFIVGIRKDLAKIFQYHLPAPLLKHRNLKDAIGDLPKHPHDVYLSTYSSHYMSRNRRRTWNQPSFTIQASGRQAPQYPGSAPMKKLGRDKRIFTGWHRRLSVREEARIQCFPDWFKFNCGRKGISKNGRLNKAYKQIGNAVPVYLAEQMTRPIMQMLLKEDIN